MRQERPLNQQVKIQEKLSVIQKITLAIGVIFVFGSLFGFTFLFFAIKTDIKKTSDELANQQLVSTSTGLLAARGKFNITMDEGDSTCCETCKSYNIEIKRNYLSEEETTIEEATDEAVSMATDILNSRNIRDQFPQFNHDYMIEKINSQVFKDWTMGKISEEEAEKLDWCNGQNGCTPTGVGSCSGGGGGGSNFLNQNWGGGGGGGSGYCISGGGGGFGGWGSCLLAGTGVSMANGTYLDIEKVKVGDLVKSYDTRTKKIVASEVVKTFKNQTDSYIIINDELKLTPNHRLFTKSGWRAAKDVKIGEVILRENGAETTVKNLKTIKDNVNTYNIQVKEFSNYFAEGYLVHNYKWGPGSFVKITVTIHFSF